MVRRVRRGGFYLPVMVFDERTALSQAVIDQWNSEVRLDIPTFPLNKTSWPQDGCSPNNHTISFNLIPCLPQVSVAPTVTCKTHLTFPQIGDPLTAASNARLAGFITGAFLLSISVSLLIVVVTTNRCRLSPERQPLLARVQVAS